MAKSSFADATAAFFAELSDILTAQQQDKEEGMELKGDRPYSSLLTQDEEPMADYSPMQTAWQEPEIITRFDS